MELAELQKRVDEGDPAAADKPVADIKIDFAMYKADAKAATAQAVVQAVVNAKADFDQKMETQIKAAEHAKAIAENRVATLESDLLKTGAIAAGSKADLEDDGSDLSDY